MACACACHIPPLKAACVVTWVLSANARRVLHWSCLMHQHTRAPHTRAAAGWGVHTHAWLCAARRPFGLGRLHGACAAMATPTMAGIDGGGGGGGGVGPPPLRPGEVAGGFTSGSQSKSRSTALLLTLHTRLRRVTQRAAVFPQARMDLQLSSDFT